MLTVIAIMAAQGRWWCPMCGAGGVMGGWMMIGWLFWLAVLVGAAVVLLRLFGGRAGGGPGGYGGSPPPERAEEILKERYARGEIDQTTYQRMLDDIRSVQHS